MKSCSCPPFSPANVLLSSKNKHYLVCYYKNNGRDILNLGRNHWINNPTISSNFHLSSRNTTDGYQHLERARGSLVIFWVTLFLYNHQSPVSNDSRSNLLQAFPRERYQRLFITYGWTPRNKKNLKRSHPAKMYYVKLAHTFLNFNNQK